MTIKKRTQELTTLRRQKGSTALKKSVKQMRGLNLFLLILNLAHLQCFETFYELFWPHEDFLPIDESSKKIIIIIKITNKTCVLSKMRTRQLQQQRIGTPTP